ncbi:MAG: dihydroorotate dehydrogenase electron transfer subunit [Candidatus Hydrogenedentes bacterium]|nr:dihydroorotate dehydrogenase electron transfer subunit [Candidatus Hydrogenedentota bacterium]
MPSLSDCEIVMHQEMAPGHFRLVLRAPEVAAEAQPGQFCMVEVQRGLFPFLRRPMCFERIFRDSFAILYRVQGEGTRILSRLRAGQTLNVQGPLGKPFPLRREFVRHILVAGGIGVAPFPALAEALIRECGVTPEAVLAARTSDILLCEQDFRQMGCKIHIATDDGSAGFHGYASELLRELAPGENTIVYCCGPTAMMKATHLVCEAANVTCLASLEAEMACGDGVCLGCVVEANIEVEAERMVRVCKDGPVFDTRLINWEAREND